MSEKKTSRRNFLKIGGAVVAAGVVAAAGYEMYQATKPTPGPATMTPTVTTPTVTTGPPATTQLQAKTLKLMSDETDPTAEKIMTGIMNDYTAKYPNVTVSPDYISINDWFPKLTASIQGGTQPDLAYLTPANVIWVAQQGELAAVDDWVKDIGANDFVQNALDMNKYQGKTYGIPASCNFTTLFYRSDLLSSKGLKPPTTLDELLNCAKTLTDKTATPPKYGIALVLGRTLQVQEVLTQIMWEYGGHLYDDKFNVTFDNPAVYKALDFYKQLANYSPPSASSWSYADQGLSFVNGESAMVIYYGRITAAIEAYNPKVADLVSNVVFPAADGKVVNYFTPKNFANFTKAKNGTEARNFVDFLMSPSELPTYLSAVPIHQVPTLKSMFTNPTYLSQPLMTKYKRIVDVQGQALNYPCLTPSMEYPGVSNPKAGAAWGSLILVDCVQNVILKGIDPHVAVQDAVTRLKALG